MIGLIRLEAQRRMARIGLNRILFASVISVSMLAWSAMAWAEVDLAPPPTYPNAGYAAPGKKIGREPATRLLLGKFRVTFERTTLSEIRRAVSSGVIQRQGDAGESLSWLCYTIKRRPQHERIWIESDEIEGGNLINGVTAENIGNSVPVSSGCPLLPRRFQPISIDRGIWLGTALTKLVGLLGNGQREANGVLRFDYRGKTKHPDKKFRTPREALADLDASSSLAVQFDGDRIIRLWAGKTTSN